MTAAWERVASPHADGVWFVLEHATSFEAIAPPGVRLLPPTVEPEPAPWVDGWRACLWGVEGRERFPELDPPDARRSLSTAEALTCLGADHRSAVEAIMVGLMHAAATLGQAGDRRALQDTGVQSSVALLTWIRDELDDAFPDRCWPDPGPAPTREEIPDTFEQFMSLLTPATPDARSGMVVRNPATEPTRVPFRPIVLERQAQRRSAPPQRSPLWEKACVLAVVWVGELVRVAVDFVKTHGAMVGAANDFGQLHRQSDQDPERPDARRVSAVH